MEKWQRTLIRENLPELLRCTSCSPVFLAYFVSGDVFSDDDVESIENERGKKRQATILYGILPQRKNGYNVLLHALLETKQTGAAEILAKDAFEQVSNLKVKLAEKTYKLNDLLKPEQIKEIQEWMQRNLPFKKRKILFENVLNLVRETIPAPDPLYIPRCLSRRLTINPALFNENCSDIFIIKGVEREQLRTYNKLFGIETSTEQLAKQKINCRFILLKAERHFIIIKSRSTTPTHLINFELETKEFLLEETTGGSEILCQNLRFGNLSDKQCLSEDEFIKVTSEMQTKSVCICDTPGMGKSLLLANIARKVAMKQDTIVSYFQLPDMHVNDKFMHHPLSFILEHISTSSLSYKILNLILNLGLRDTNEIGLGLFFDGLDEIQHERLETVREFLRSIHNAIPSAKMYITARPVVRKGLEQIANAICYDIQPFNEERQVHYLTSIWAQKFPSVNQDHLIGYAGICLQKLQESLSEEEKCIAGVPLLCKMIADVFADEALAYAEKRSESVQQTFQISLYVIYQRYIERQLGRTECKFRCIKKNQSPRILCNDDCHVKSFHLFCALKLLWPNKNEIDQLCNNFEKLHLQQKFRPGILKQKNTKESTEVKFVHRTFAEYLVAEYIAKEVLETCKPSTFLLEKFLLNEFIRCRETVVVHFVNAFLQDLQTQVEFVPRDLRPLSEEDFAVACLNCIENNSEKVLELVLLSQKGSSLSPEPNAWHDKKQVEKNALEILTAAAKRCSIPTLKNIEQFYIEQYNFWIMRPPNPYKTRYIEALRISLRRADYEVAFLFLDKADKINLHGYGLLAHCLGYTYSESIELVERRIEIARLLLQKRPSLLYSNLLETPPLCATQLHPKAIRFLLQEGGNNWRIDSSGITFFHFVVYYMTEEEIQDLCHFIFVGRPVLDLLLIFSQEELQLRFPFLRARALLKLLPLANKVRAVVSEEAFGLFWETGKSTTSQFASESYLAVYDLSSMNREVLERLLFLAWQDEGGIPLISLLLKHDKSFVELKNYKQKTPLLFAIANCQMELFELLVSKSANVFAIDKYGRTVLHTAARTKDWKVFRRVVEVLGNLSEESTAVPVSTTNTSATTGKAPTNFHELFHWKSKCGWQSGTPLHAACKYFELPLDTLDLFLAGGKAPRSGNHEIYVVDINAVNSSGRTALFDALFYSRSLEFVKHLVKRGADWSIKDKNGLNAAHICAGKCLLEHLKYFVELGSDVNETNIGGNNALQIAVRSGSSELVEYLISAGADKRHKNKKGDTAYDIAVRNMRSPDILALLYL